MAKKKSANMVDEMDGLEDLLDDLDETVDEAVEEETAEETSDDDDLDGLLDVESEEKADDDDDDDLDGLLDDESEEKAAVKKTAAKGKAAKGKTKKGTEPPAVTKNNKKKADLEKAVEKKQPAKKKAEKDPDHIEGLTKSTKESGTISFAANSGSQGLLLLIAKFGYDKKKVLKAAETKKFGEKYFSKCDPEKKYGKVAGIIKKLTNAGYKMPKVD